MNEQEKLQKQFVDAVRKLSEENVQKAIDQLNGDNYLKIRRYFLEDEPKEEESQ